MTNSVATGTERNRLRPGLPPGSRRGLREPYGAIFHGAEPGSVSAKHPSVPAPLAVGGRGPGNDMKTLVREVRCYMAGKNATGILCMICFRLTVTNPYGTISNIKKRSFMRRRGWIHGSSQTLHPEPRPERHLLLQVLVRRPKGREHRTATGSGHQIRQGPRAQDHQGIRRQGRLGHPR